MNVIRSLGKVNEPYDAKSPAWFRQDGLLGAVMEDHKSSPA